MVLCMILVLSDNQVLINAIALDYFEYFECELAVIHGGGDGVGWQCQVTAHLLSDTIVIK